MRNVHSSAVRPPAAVAILSIALGVSALFAPVAVAAPSPADAAILQAGVVQPVDLPLTWTQQPPRPTRPKFASIAACRQIQRVNDAGQRAPHRESGTWFDPAVQAQTTVASDVVVAFKQPTGADAFLAAYQDPKAATCLQADFRRGLAPRIKKLHPTITFSAIPDANGIGGGSVGYEIVLTVTTPDVTQTVVNDNVVMKVGRAAIVLTTQDTGPLRNLILATLANRLAAAQPAG